MNRRWQHFYQHSDFLDLWRNQTSELGRYFALYGGITALGKSPYLHCAAIVAIVVSSVYPPLSGFGQVGVSVIPNLLGFTMGGMAIVLAVASSRIFVRLAEDGEPQSFFMKMIAGFLHYIVSQSIALVVCFLTYNGTNWIANVIAGTAIIYCVLVPISVGVQLFQMARIYNAHASIKNSSDPDL